MPVTSDDSFLVLLRHSTKPMHDALEERVNVENRARDLASYRNLLARFYGFYAPFEEAIGHEAELKELGIHRSERLKAPKLAADLRHLGLAAAELPRCTEVPTPQTLAQALGCQYVLEGATLGGQIIKRVVHRELALSADNGCAFFESYGSKVGEMWRSFRGALSGYASTQERQASIIAAAQDTFRSFDGWLAQEVAR